MVIKICGITNIDDARQALECGADWIGLNLVSGPRKIEIATALAIARQLPDASRAVALVVTPFIEERDSESDLLPAEFTALRHAGVLRLQLYGAVTREVLFLLHGRGFETMLVRHVMDERALDLMDEFLAKCGNVRPDYVLFDAPPGEQPGGTGRRANWSALEVAHAAGRYSSWPPVVLAGGLTPDNVGQAIRTVHPAGVDVSSGVESVPGRKDPAKVRRFVETARQHAPHSPRGS